MTADSGVKVRSGLLGEARFSITSNLITPLSGSLLGESGWQLVGLVSPGVSIADVPASTTFVVDNTDLLRATLTGETRTLDSNTTFDVFWLLNNIGTANEQDGDCGTCSGGGGFLPTPPDLEETPTYFYWGWSSIDGAWLVRRTDRSNANYLDATVVSNPSYPSYSDAWQNRASLNYT